MSLRLTVICPDGSEVIFEADPTDVPRSIAVALADHLPKDRNVILLHNGSILSPYLTFMQQHIKNEHRIVIYPMKPGPQP
jgi:hypothetical protein